MYQKSTPRIALENQPGWRKTSASVSLNRIGQLAIAVFASVAVFSFTKMAEDSERRRVCAPLCLVEPAYANQNRRAPDFELPALDGGKRRLSDHRGRLVVLNFWTESCKPCLEELPSLARFAERLSTSGRGVVLTINTDPIPTDVHAKLRAVLGHEHLPFEVLRDPELSVVKERFGTTLYPETWFIDADGLIRARIDGARNYDQPLFLDLVESLSAPLTCPIVFSRGEARGAHAPLCDEFVR